MSERGALIVGVGDNYDLKLILLTKYSGPSGYPGTCTFLGYRISEKVRITKISTFSMAGSVVSN